MKTKITERKAYFIADMLVPGIIAAGIVPGLFISSFPQYYKEICVGPYIAQCEQAKPLRPPLHIPNAPLQVITVPTTSSTTTSADIEAFIKAL